MFVPWLNKTGKSIFSINFPQCPGLFLSSVHTFCYGYSLLTNHAFFLLKGHTKKFFILGNVLGRETVLCGTLQVWTADQV